MPPVLNIVKTLIVVLACSCHAYATADTEEVTILFIGDSLTAGYGIEPDLAYPVLIEHKIHDTVNTPIKIINGSISGSTTASGLSRLNWYERLRPQIVLVALGANDGLRGVPIKESRKNLKAMIAKIKSWGATVILAGMKLPPNYGAQYTDDFEKMFEAIAEEEELIFIPFLLKDVGGEPELNLPDGIHPNAKGHQIIADTVYPYIKEAL